MRSRFWKRRRSRFSFKRWAAQVDRLNLERRKVQAIEALVSKFDELILWVRLLNNRNK